MSAGADVEEDVIHIGIGNPELPDTGEVCCMGVAVYGPERCTCWEDECDQEQAPVQQGPVMQRSTMCTDCAFRKDSPERAGDERYQHAGVEGLADLLSDGGAFFCHQGMRKKLALVHPTGARVVITTDAYDPAQTSRHAFKADGRPADLCAGWCATMRRLEREP